MPHVGLPGSKTVYRDGAFAPLSWNPLLASLLLLLVGHVAGDCAQASARESSCGDLTRRRSFRDRK